MKAPAANYEKDKPKGAILDMLKEEDGHFTTPIFLGMNGHDISVAFPRESEVICDAKKLFKGEIEIEHTDLEGFWRDAEKYLDHSKMTVLKGERRSYLKQGKWTYLFPGTISARTYLKQADFNAYTALCYIAEPLNALAGNDSKRYFLNGDLIINICDYDLESTNANDIRIKVNGKYINNFTELRSNKAYSGGIIELAPYSPLLIKIDKSEFTADKDGKIIVPAEGEAADICTATIKSSAGDIVFIGQSSMPVGGRHTISYTIGDFDPNAEYTVNIGGKSGFLYAKELK